MVACHLPPSSHIQENFSYIKSTDHKKRVHQIPQSCAPPRKPHSHGKLKMAGSCFSEAEESSEFLHAPWLNLGTWGYCWWKKSCYPVEVGSLSHYLQGLIHARWLAGLLPSTVLPRSGEQIHPKLPNDCFNQACQRMDGGHRWHTKFYDSKGP